MRMAVVLEKIAMGMKTRPMQKYAMLIPVRDSL
mgnify:CR=1 FL=1